MNMICPSMPIPASTELTEFLYIWCRKKITEPLFRRPYSAGAQSICPLPCLPSTTADELPRHTFKFGLLCYRYNLQDKIQI